MRSANGYVVDASVVVRWFADDPFSEIAAGLRASPLHAPDLLLADCASLLWEKGRRSEMTVEEIGEATDLLKHAAISLHPTRPLLEKILELARALDHPVYDCAYVATAWLLELPLVSANVDLARAIGGSGIDKAKLPTILPLAAFAL